MGGAGEAGGGGETRIGPDPFETQAGHYRKRLQTVQVRFATSAGPIATREGVVQAGVGDAIITGVEGEQWPVRHPAFTTKYAPVTGTVMGQDGVYMTRPQAVRASRQAQAFSVNLGDGVGVLAGQGGDWLVEYGPGDRAVVGAAIFARTYCATIDHAPLVIGLSAPAGAPAHAAAARLAAALAHTDTILLSADEGKGIDAAFFDRLTGRFHPLPQAHIVLPDLEGVDAGPLESQNAYLSHHSALVLHAGSAADAAAAYRHALPYWTPASHAQDRASAAQGMFGLPAPAPMLASAEVLTLAQRLEEKAQQAASPVGALGALLRGFFKAPAKPSPATTLLSHLAELDAYNGETLAAPATDHADPPSRLSAAQVRADALASVYQDRWQRLVFSTTRTIATGDAPGGALREWGRRIVSLSGCGIGAALAFAAYTELSGGCTAEDWFAPVGCASAGWQHWAGLLFVAAYVGVLLLALWRYGDGKARQLERKHQDYRLLAECLRVQDVWARSGIDQLVADSLPPRPLGDASWVVPAVRAMGMLYRDDVRHSAPSAAVLQRDFVLHQLDYHENIMLQRREAACHYLGARANGARIVFILSIAALCINTVGETLFHHGFEGMAHHLLVLLTIAALAYWAANKKVLENFGLESEIKRARVLQEALQNAADLIAAPGGQARQMAVIAGLGVLFAADQANWHTLHRERPVEAVTGG